jgi:biotin carboxyl carrier protein
VAGGAVAEARLIEIDNQIKRLETSVQALQRELQSRGFSNEQITDVSQGRFLREIEIKAPVVNPNEAPQVTGATSRVFATEVITASIQSPAENPIFELQETKVELGQQVQAGQTLCLLANHQLLTIEGRAFREETALLERSVRERWPLEVDFFEREQSDWPALKSDFQIRQLGNTIDPEMRTFSFYLPLQNQMRVIENDGIRQLLWRFRPGQKVRLSIRVEKLDNVFVLPAEAVTRDGAEAYVFTQNVNTFERESVRLLTQDRHSAVIANDGSLVPGSFVVQLAAAQLNRMAKAGAGVTPSGYHVHADGSLHKNGED